MKHLFTINAAIKGWSQKELADRWGIKPRQMSNISSSPKQIHWDALSGLPDRRGDM